MKTLIKLLNNLLVRIALAIAIGILFGGILPEWIVRIFVTFTGLFRNFLTFIVPLIIIGLITPGIANLGKGGGKLLFITVIIAYISTLTGMFFAMYVGATVVPQFVTIDASVAEQFVSMGKNQIVPFFNIDFPPIMSPMTAMVFAFCVGIAMTVVKSDSLKRVTNEFMGVVEFLIKKVLIPWLPLNIVGIFMNMAYTGQISSITKVFGVVVLCVMASHYIILTLQYSIAGVYVKSNPFNMMTKMIPAYITALGTQSSSATLPVTLDCASKMGINANIVRFAIPLLATIHLTGCAMSVVMIAQTILVLYGIPFDPYAFSGFILMMGIAAVAAPSIPGGTVMASLGLLQSMLGFSAEMTGLIIAIYFTQSSFCTACNASGDGALTSIINKIAGFKLQHKKQENLIV